jgi:DNA-binding transcriptional regulator GbsR (MarR family)
MTGEPQAERTIEDNGQPPDRPHVDDVVRQFVEHWGMMARAWGINATMGELFALLYITGEDWTADALRTWLRVSRGNVSMNLRELMAWGVVHKVHRHGQRSEYYRAESDVWTLFRRILHERRRRELDPTLGLLDRTFEQVRHESQRGAVLERIDALRQFFGLINSLASRLLTLEPADAHALRQLFEDVPPAVPDDELRP